MDAKMSEEEFVIRAIKKLTKPPYKGIHSVFSGFNQAFREYFNKDPVEVTKRLAQEGKIVSRPGGGMKPSGASTGSCASWRMRERADGKGQARQG